MNRQPGGRRGREGIWLLLASLGILWGLLLLLGELEEGLLRAEEGLAAGEVVHLGNVDSGAELLHLLPAEPTAERDLLAREIWRYTNAHRGKLRNVGQLRSIQVAAAEIRGREDLPDLLGRLRGGTTVGLLSAHRLQQLKPHLVVRDPQRFRWILKGHLALFFLSFLALHLLLRLRRFQGDEFLLPITLALTGLGLLMMLSLQDPLRDRLLFVSFVQGVVGGCLALAVASQLNVERLRLFRVTYLPLSLALALSALLIVFGRGPGASDVKINLFGFQPIELVKILVVFFLAGYFHRRWEFLRELRESRLPLPQRIQLPRLEYLVPPLLALGLVLSFFFLQRDLGPALVLSFLFLLLYAMARARVGMLLAGALLVVSAFAVGYQMDFPRTVSARIGMWLSPWSNNFLGGDHLAQSLWALASGGFWGTGLGQGRPAYLPAAHTDLVLAVLGEQAGFVGIMLVLLLYGCLLHRTLNIAQRAASTYSMFMATGFALLFGLQTLLIAGGILGLLPLSGVVSPFLSYGRTALITGCFLVGVLLSISAGTTAELHHFSGALRRLKVGVAIVLALLGLRAAQVQLLQGDEILVRGVLAVQGDGVQRIRYNPRITELASTIPRGDVVDRKGVVLATGSPSERAYPFGGLTYHLLGHLPSRAQWGAGNTTFAERDARIELQGYDDRPADRGPEPMVGEHDYRELVPLWRHRSHPSHPKVRGLLDRDRTLRLTLDSRLQVAIADLLESTLREAGLERGAVVVLDANHGDLLASVTYPWPTTLPPPIPDTADTTFDRPRYGLYPPGSAFKVLTAMAALRKDPTLLHRPFRCQRLEDGRVGTRVPGYEPLSRDDSSVLEPHGEIRLERALSVSCNAFFALLGTSSLGAESLLDTASLFGIDTALPNTPGQLADALPQAAYGQGQVLATPLEMATIAATVANGGRRPSPRWRLAEPEATQIAILPPALNAHLGRAMRRAVTEGTARRLAEHTPPIAGKTGTAEVVGQNPHAWFIGFAPANTTGERPIAFAILLEHGGYGGNLAALLGGQIVTAADDLGLLASPQGETS